MLSPNSLIPFWLTDFLEPQQGGVLVFVNSRAFRRAKLKVRKQARRRGTR